MSRRARLPAALPEFGPAVAAAALVLGLPASVLIDEALDTASPRVNSIANENAKGVRMFVARPPAPAGGSGAPTKRPAVILIHQILGLQRREADLAAALAAQEDVVAVAPDCFQGQSTLWPFRAITLGFRANLQQQQATRVLLGLFRACLAKGVLLVAVWDGPRLCLKARGTALTALLVNKFVETDSWRRGRAGNSYALRDGASWGVESVHEAVRWLKAQPDVDPDRIIVAGFCYGGGAAVRYAAAYPGEAAAVTIFYGRPLLEASEVAKLGRTPVLGLYGTKDAQFPASMLEKFKADLTASGVPHRLEMFEGEGHAFIKEAKSVEQGGAAGRAWELFRAFIRDVAAGRTLSVEPM
ncbi:hypothetical protein HYH02_012654 [Chlamydomonas schloesseri]|uniref:Dienelactone hydrolase domain-containing protein n=1 Tax=Chlamydomonas schloesseri TaxID=2026947 RepID=A0A835SUE8_9CHLO|nr:hypothetical protein HYH02_012654 [Chlamydomonas schloesseri]|eukprot:KAG2433537.1 hypothetical protein HYH02_012654 [Chlamydomonas schloesseri]